MNRLRYQARRTVRKALPKLFSSFLILLLILQPIGGTLGALSLQYAIAESETSSAPAVTEDVVESASPSIDEKSPTVEKPETKSVESLPENTDDAKKPKQGDASQSEVMPGIAMDTAVDVPSLKSTPSHNKVRICHATASENNPFVSETPNTSGALMGHVGMGHQHGEDIIPPIEGCLPDGQNWDDAGEAIWRNDCHEVVIKQGALTVKKVVVNNDGGNKQVADFVLSVGKTVVKSDKKNTFDVGTYTVSEVQLPGYKGTFSGDCDADGKVNITKNKDKVCVLTNDDIAPTLTVTKVVVNGALGTKQVSDFPLFVSKDSKKTGVKSGVSQAFSVGSYVVSEVSNDEYNSVISGDCSADGKVRLSFGDTKSCVITNTYKFGKIVIEKQTLPNKSKEKFAFDTNYSRDFELSDGQKNESEKLVAGTYAVREKMTNGWDLSSAVCSDHSPINAIVVAGGETVTCVFTNAKRGHLVVDKITNPTHDETQFGITASGTGSITGGGKGVISNDTSKDYEVTPGVYTVDETDHDGWQESSNTCRGVVVGAGETKRCTITNTQLGEITLVKKTVGGDGEFHFALSGKSLPKSATIETSHGEGMETFSNVDPQNNYSIVENVPQGWRLDDAICKAKVLHDDDDRRFQGESDEQDEDNHTIDPRHIRVSAGGHVTCTFTNTKLAEITLVKKTIGGDGVFNFDMTGATLPESAVIETVGGEGSKTFSNIDPRGVYSITENIPAGWELDDASCSNEYEDVSNDESVMSQDENSAKTEQQYRSKGYAFAVNDIRVRAGDHITCTFNNTKLGHIIVDKQTTPEGALQSFDFTLTEKADATDEVMIFESQAAQTFSLTDSATPYDSGAILPGTYTLSEKEQAGWKMQEASCVVKNEQESDARQEVRTFPIDAIDVQAGETLVCTVVNAFTSPTLQIEKTNDATAAKRPGADVTYTLVVKAPSENGTVLFDTIVTDLPPHGFTYRLGSWTAHSSVRGDIKGSVTTEPTYHSPGVWKLGTMVQGEEVTLTYMADISASQEAGLYDDLAWSKGKSIVGDIVLANSESQPTPFVGTQVAVELPQKPVPVVLGTSIDRQVKHKTVYKTQRVLGATLPETGTPTMWLMIAFGLLMTGFTLLLWTMRNRIKGIAMKSTLQKIFSRGISVLVVGVFAILAQASSVQAAPNVSIQIETPKAVIATSQFEIGFVAMDILGRPTTVECFKKGPADASFIRFATLPLINGGTSGNCSVDASVASLDGMYMFHAVVKAGAESVTSNDVTVQVALSNVPSAPTNYVRNQVDSCTNTMTFTTADDAGKTVKVELYRSTANTFVADASTKVQEVTLTSNQNGSMTDVVADCAVEYFYIVRAVSASGDGSDFVGDVVVTIDKETKTRTKTITKKIDGPVATSALAVATQKSSVADDAAKMQQGDASATSNEEKDLEQGQVLGENVDFSAGNVEAASLFATYGFGTLVVGMIALFGWFIIRKKK